MAKRERFDFKRPDARQITDSIVHGAFITATEMPLLDGFAFLRWLMANNPTPVSDSNIAAELEVSQDEAINLTPAAEVQLIRIIQEALTNVRKHARASHANAVWRRAKCVSSAGVA